jgi:long-chain acyl-CoA synthetase
MVDVYTVKVEEARPASHEKPSAGPVYRCIYAKDGLLELPSHFQSPWDFFRYCINYNYSFSFSSNTKLACKVS